MNPEEDDRRAGLPPPRFSLAALMWGMAALGAIFATLGYVGPHATLLLVLLVLAIGAHVAGNALGTQLRSSGDRPLVRGGNLERRPERGSLPVNFAPPAPLSQRTAPGKATIVATIAGAVLGGALGGYGLTLLMLRATPFTVLLAVCASAVLGGIWAFLAASFVQVSLGAAWQATREQGQSDRKPTQSPR